MGRPADDAANGADGVTDGEEARARLTVSIPRFRSASGDMVRLTELVSVEVGRCPRSLTFRQELGEFVRTKTNGQLQNQHLLDLFAMKGRLGSQDPGQR